MVVIDATQVCRTLSPAPFPARGAWFYPNGEEGLLLDPKCADAKKLRIPLTKEACRV